MFVFVVVNTKSTGSTVVVIVRVIVAIWGYRSSCQVVVVTRFIDVNSTSSISSCPVNLPANLLLLFVNVVLVLAIPPL